MNDCYFCDGSPLECLACLWQVKTWAPERYTAASGDKAAQAVLVDEWIAAGYP